MVTSGSLKSRSVIDILKKAESSGFTGVVTLKGKTGLATITLLKGVVIDVREPRVRSRLGRFLVRSNVITEKELQEALTTQKEKGERSYLGEILIDQGVLDKVTLDNSMRAVIEDSLIHLLGWDEGLFRVEESEEVTGDPVGVAPITELAEKAKQLAVAVEEDWVLSELIPDSEKMEDSILDEVNAVLKRVSQKMRDLKPEEVILLVEDEALMREMFKDKLKSFGFEVDAVETPRLALDKLSEYEEEGKLPIVLSDLIMPTLSGKGLFGGLELLEEIQKTSSHIPVIVNTAYPDATIRRRALFLGATYYIHKPERKDISPEELENQLNLFIEEVALCIQNVIQRHEIYFERDQQNILREELLSQLVQAQEELQQVGELVKRDVGDIRFLRATSDKMVREKSLGKMAETIVEFASSEMDRSAVFLVRKDRISGFFGNDRREEGDGFGDRVKSLDFSKNDSPMFDEAISSGSVVMEEDPGDKLGDAILTVLGDPAPKHAVILPIMVQKLVVALMYGDVVPGGPPIRDMDSLEILLNLASMSLEIQQQMAVINKLRSSN